MKKGGGMKRMGILGALGILALAVSVGIAGAQTYLEPAESATVMELTADMVTEDDDTEFAAGDQDSVRSALYQAWKYTSIQGTARGDSVTLRIYVYGGDVDRETAMTPDDDTRQFALMDSLDVSAAGNFSRQVSSWMQKCRYFYLRIVGLTDNGHETYIEGVKAIRERY
jgi:hypothetical protein